ncbi:hypothetical protein M422DRAFT_220966 [Sphaerobolus stellatus SS14]|nr:hypothetical protein M422DRAFT_220966 [Sphaerobolus stellatus SS14]
MAEVDQPLPHEREISRSLEKLKTQPIATGGSGDDVMVPIYTFLMGAPPKDGVLHWFCAKTRPVVIEAASFLLRLYAYNSDSVVIWKGKLTEVLHGCSDCVEVYMEVKLKSRDSYFAAFDRGILDTFFTNLEKWEVKTALKAIAEAGVTSNPDKGISDIRPAIFYHILAAPYFFEDAELLRTLGEHPPSHKSVITWPNDLPPGLLLLRFHKLDQIRTWAHHQMRACQPIENFSARHERVLRAVIMALISNTVPAPPQENATTDPLHLYFSLPPSALWSGMQDLIRILPRNFATDNNQMFRILCRSVLGHLHDTGSHFPDVLRVFVHLLKAHGKLLWEGEDNDYCQMVFDSIKDNTAYMKLFQDAEGAISQQFWFLDWFRPYLNSIRDQAASIEVLKRIVSFACEELQHERFGNKRPIAMLAVLQTLEASFNPKVTAMNQAIIDVLSIHGDIIVEVAFSKARREPEWQTSRTAARRVLKRIFKTEADTVEASISILARRAHGIVSGKPPEKQYEMVKPLLHAQMWERIYGTVSGDDIEAMAFLISLIAPWSHLDMLSEEAYLSRPEPPAGQEPEPLTSAEKIVQGIIQTINPALKVMRSGFSETVSQFTASNQQETIKALLARDDMVKFVIALAFSPIEELQYAAQNLLGQAYDVFDRSECFREVLKAIPSQALSAFIEVLATFEEYGRLLPEACGLAKSLVRGMSDVIEVLTDGRNGLLFDDDFQKACRPQGKIPHLWGLMCTACTVIFRRTPSWSKWFDSAPMVDWMRDALIFARDLLGRRIVFENAAVADSQGARGVLGTPRKPSKVARQMLEDLQPVLTEALRWLRLTDLELLHQSSNLILSLIGCFRQAEVRPSADSLYKLQKILKSARDGQPGNQQKPPVPGQNLPKSKLVESQLVELDEALAFFTGIEDDSQVLKESKLSRPSSEVSQSKDVSSSDKTHTQTTLNTFIKKPQTVAKTGTSSSSRVIVSTSTLRKTPAVPSAPKTGKSTSQSGSLMAQVRSQAVAQSRPALPPRPMKPAVAATSASTKPLVSVKVSSDKIKDERKPIEIDDSSSSSDESEDDDEPTGLAALSKMQRSPTINKQKHERRGIKLLDDVITRQNPALERLRKKEEIERTQSRLRPDLHSLHKTILSWNYDHDGPEPPIGDKTFSYTPIPDIFRSNDEYHNVFKPLLMLECWNQLQKSKEEAPSDILAGRAVSRQYVSEELVDITVVVVDRIPEKWRASEMDVLLLRHATERSTALGKVQSSQRTGMELQMTLRCYESNARAVLINSQWQISKVFSLSTISREFAALAALKHYDFFSLVLKPRLSPIPKFAPSQIERAMKTHQVNEPQAAAILGSMQTEGFSLIQGPPGTGKTWTICGIVGSFLSSRPRPATIIQTGRPTNAAAKQPSLKILVCAPSNAAIDEVAKRLRDGVRTSDGKIVVPNVVRVGAEEAINVSVRDISLDHLVDDKLSDNQKSNDSGKMRLVSLRAEMDALVATRNSKLQEMTNIEHNTSRLEAIQQEVKSLNAKRFELGRKLNNLKDQQVNNRRTLDAARRKCRIDVLQDADVICSTLSGAGHEVLENVDFEMVIIDEAAQSVELSSLIPLRFRAKRCIMVGDPQQLPPTVLSPLAMKYKYDQSLFLRLQKSRPDAVHLLSIQYRMHPDISRLPSKLFYGERLLDGPGMAEKTIQPWHTNSLFGSYKFVNVFRGKEQGAVAGHSMMNTVECDVAVALYNRLNTEYAKLNLDFKVGVISMYRAQLLQLKKTFRAAFGADIVNKVDFNTVDGFQGQEKDIIILSCVRAGPQVQSIGFLADQRRLNVAMTRARSSLFILGNASTLERSDPLWRQIVDDARSTSRLFDADSATYRRPAGSIMPSAPVKPSAPSRPILIPQNLTPLGKKEEPKPKPALAVSIQPSSGASSDQSSSKAEGKRPATETEDEAAPHKKPRTSNDSESTTTQGDSSSNATAVKPRKPPPKPMLIKKKKPNPEASIFIPKKKPDLKRPAPDASHGDAKRRITDRYYP